MSGSVCRWDRKIPKGQIQQSSATQFYHLRGCKAHPHQLSPSFRRGRKHRSTDYLWFLLLKSVMRACRYKNTIFTEKCCYTIPLWSVFRVEDEFLRTAENFTCCWAKFSFWKCLSPRKWSRKLWRAYPKWSRQTSGIPYKTTSATNGTVDLGQFLSFIFKFQICFSWSLEISVLWLLVIFPQSYNASLSGPGI